MAVACPANPREGVGQVGHVDGTLGVVVRNTVVLPAVSGRSEGVSTDEILWRLNLLQEGVEYPQIADACAVTLLSYLRAWCSLYSHRPHVHVLLGFHDALAYNDAWRQKTRRQYKQAYRILSVFFQRRVIDTGRIGKTLAELHAAGFDTLPFCGE